MIEILQENEARMEKSDLKEKMELGGSDSTKDTIFAELIEAGIEAEAVREKENELVLKEGYEFLKNKSISQVIDEELRN